MKSYVSYLILGGVIASMLLGLPVFRGTPSGIVATVHAQVPRDSEACSVATLNGAYGFFRTGITSAGPLAAVGIATFDGKGGSTARQTIRKNGITVADLFTDPALSGPYQVDPDCAARFLNPDGSVFAHAVVVDGGNELFILSLSDANDVYGVMKKISSRRELKD
jgi:hypothetical protein